MLYQTFIQINIIIFTHTRDKYNKIDMFLEIIGGSEKSRC